MPQLSPELYLDAFQPSFARQPRRKRAAVLQPASSASSSSSASTYHRRQTSSSSANVNPATLPASTDLIALSYGFLNDQLAYSVPITLPNDTPASLLVATGAGDTWLASDTCDGSDCPPQAYDVASSSSMATTLNRDWNATYIDGSASGTIYTASSFGLAQNVIASQAFGSADRVQSINFDNMNVTGLLGLSLPSSSAVQSAIIGESGNANNRFVSASDTGNILSGLWQATDASSTTPRIISLGLQRLPSDGGSRSVNSSLTIGGVDAAYLAADQYSSISFAPVAVTSYGGYAHWTLSLTSLSVTSNGTTAAIPISFAGQRTVNPTVVLDSGSSLNYAPTDMLNAMYGAVVDARGNRLGPGSNGIYYVPCDLPINITLTLSSDLTIPIHPLDASLYQSYSDVGVGRASQGCIGSFQSLLSTDSTAGADIVLGTPFLRNAYTVLSCEGELAGVANPSGDRSVCPDAAIGLRPLTTDWTQAYDDFESVRVRNEPLGDNAAWGITYSASSASSGGLNTGAKVAIGIVSSLVAIIGLFVLTLFIARRRHARRGNGDEDGYGRMDKEGTWTVEKGREGDGHRRSHSSSRGVGGGDGDARSTLGQGGEAGEYDYSGRRLSLSAKEQAQLREAALLHGFYDADLFSDDPAGASSRLQPTHARPRFRESDQSGEGAGLAFAVESTDSRGYGEARRIQKDYLRRHPSLERERERENGAAGTEETSGAHLAPGGGSGSNIRGPSNGVDIEMEERSSATHANAGAAGGSSART